MVSEDANVINFEFFSFLRQNLSNMFDPILSVFSHSPVLLLSSTPTQQSYVHLKPMGELNVVTGVSFMVPNLDLVEVPGFSLFWVPRCYLCPNLSILKFHNQELTLKKRCTI